MSAPIEVRQCPKCSAPAVVLVTEWQHTTSGVATGAVTKEYRCQACGAWQVLRPTLSSISLWVAGILLLPACGLGLPFIWVAWQNGRFDERVKRVDAPAPVMKFPGGPPKRQCTCGGVAAAVEITRHTHRGIPTGTEFVYACASCKKQFETENVLGHFTSSFLTVACLGVALAFLAGATSPMWRWGGGGVMALITALVGWAGVSKLVNRFKYKEVEAPVVAGELR